MTPSRRSTSYRQWHLNGLVFAPFFLMIASLSQADALQEQAQALFGDGQPPVMNYSEAEAELGRLLFFDDRIGRDGTHCGSCHLYSEGGADGRKTAKGAFGREGNRNVPTVVDIVPQLSMHWSGDRASLAEQATRALTAPPAYAHDTTEEAIAVINKLPDLTAKFEKVYPEGVSVENWGKALSAYQESLVTTSDFDRYLQGDENALNEAQTEGLKTFMNTGCATCHNSRILGGTSYQKFGVFADYTKYTNSKEDVGRMAFTGKESDRRVFKVPPIRHAVKTAPYFHDGSIAELKDAVQIMAKVQLGKTLSEKENQAILTFLQAASAPMPEAMRQPE